MRLSSKAGTSYLATGISGQQSIQAMAWALLAAFKQIYSEK